MSFRALDDRYRVEREIGAGGMATVYLARDLKHSRQVALKVLRPELGAVLGPERFLSEINVTANLQHPHLLPLFDSGEADGLLFYVMPYIEGESLRARLERERQLPVEEAVRIAVAIASALDYAHRHGVIHRDLKPENILLHDGQPLVTDFGIALAVSQAGGARVTQTGLSLGTPQYMSPEQATGDRVIDARSDVYSLAAVLYEMLTGDPPHSAGTTQAIVAKVLTEKPPSVRVYRDAVPQYVDSAIQRALAKLPADRFASAAEFSEALTGARAVQPMSDGPLAAQKRAPRAVRALPWTIAAMALLLAGFSTWLESPDQVTRSRVTLWPRGAASGYVAMALAISDDGRTFIFADSADGQTHLWLKRPGQLDAVLITGTAGAEVPALSPNGEWVAFIADGKLKKVALSGGPAVTLSDSAQTVPPGVAWLTEDVLVYIDRGYNVVRIDADGGNAAVVYSAARMQNGAVGMTVLPRARGLLVATCTFACVEQDVTVLDLRSGEARVLDEDGAKAWYLDGAGIVLVRDDGSVHAAPFNLRSLTLESSLVPVFDGVHTPTGLVDLTVSRSGTLVYSQGDAGAPAIAQPVWVSVGGVVTPVDPEWTIPEARVVSLALSPDGRRIAVSYASGTTRDVWVKQLPDGPFTRLTFNLQTRRPFWSPDGRVVYYLAADGDVLMSSRADGTGAVDTVADLEHSIVAVDLGAEDNQYLLALRTGAARDIFVHDAGRNTTRPLLAADGVDELSPSLSPDGRWLAYTSNESGRREVYVRPFPDVDAGRWQVSRSGGSEPRWSRSGQALFYRDQRRMLMRATVSAGEAFATVAEVELFSTDAYEEDTPFNAYDVAPGDSAFLFIRWVRQGENVGSASVVVVENWLAELREIIKGRK